MPLLMWAVNAVLQQGEKCYNVWRNFYDRCNVIVQFLAARITATGFSDRTKLITFIIYFTKQLRARLRNIPETSRPACSTTLECADKELGWNCLLALAQSDNIVQRHATEEHSWTLPFGFVRYRWRRCEGRSRDVRGRTRLCRLLQCG